MLEPNIPCIAFAGEWYCSRLCSHLGIDAPACRPISKEDAELLKEAMNKTAWTKAESRQQLASFTSQTVTLMEFVAGQVEYAVDSCDSVAAGTAAAAVSAAAAVISTRSSEI